MKKYIILIVLFIGSISLVQAQNCSITFKIKGLKSNEGQILISIFNTKESFMKDFIMGEVIGNLSGKEVTIVFKDLPPGSYAASVFHDVNMNGELDTNWIGIPKEDYGFSNDARGTMGPPDYEDCKFKVSAANVHHEITLK